MQRDYSDTDLACSVVIPTYNAATTLDAQLGALARQVFTEPFEVVVADNGSTDTSAEVARAWRGRLDLRVVDASRGKGVSVARNVGIDAARSDVILICDADDVACDVWVRSMVEALTVHAFVGGALESRSLSGAEAASWVPIEELTMELPSVWGGRTYAFGGNLGMHRRVFRAAGGFNESYPAGAEEIDFAWRAREAGFTPHFVPEAVIHYRIRSDLRGVLRQQFNSGLGTAQLFATFRPTEVSTKRWHRRLRHEIRLIGQFPLLGSPDSRRMWLSMMAFEVGKLLGARAHGAPAP